MSWPTISVFLLLCGIRCHVNYNYIRHRLAGLLCYSIFSSGGTYISSLLYRLYSKKWVWYTFLIFLYGFLFLFLYLTKEQVLSSFPYMHSQVTSFSFHSVKNKNSKEKQCLIDLFRTSFVKLIFCDDCIK